MRNDTIISIQFLFLVLFVSCSTAQKTENFKEIKPMQLSEKMENDADIIVIDVRTPGEFNNELGHVPGSVLKPLQQIEQWHADYSGDKDAEIFLVCRSGNRSGVAAGYLAGKGYKNVYNMVGGLIAWNKVGLEVERDGK